MAAISARPIAHDTKSKIQTGSNVAWSVGDPTWGEPRHGMRAQIVHRVELVRHGETTSNKVLTENGDTTFTPDPMLTAWGERQGANIASFYKRMTEGATAASMPPSNLRIEVSPYRRAIGTSLPTQRVFEGAPVEALPELREYSREERGSAWLQSHDSGTGEPLALRWLCAVETYQEFRSRVDSTIARWKARGTKDARAHTVAFTHSLFISAVLTHLIPLASHEDEPPQFFHIPNGSITVIDFDTEGRMHVHCVGFTEHLRQPTGQHTAHVDCYDKMHLRGPWSRERPVCLSPTREESVGGRLASAPGPGAHAALTYPPGVYVPPCYRRESVLALPAPSP